MNFHLIEKTILILEKELKTLVNKMGMQQAEFKIELNKGNEFYDNGTDQISFMFSANRGSSFKTLKKVVSGGELSRIMLAIKAILSQYKKLPTLVFDEIDSGYLEKFQIVLLKLWELYQQNYRYLRLRIYLRLLQKEIIILELRKGGK